MAKSKTFAEREQHKQTADTHNQKVTHENLALSRLLDEVLAGHNDHADAAQSISILDVSPNPIEPQGSKLQSILGNKETAQVRRPSQDKRVAQIEQLIDSDNTLTLAADALPDSLQAIADRVAPNTHNYTKKTIAVFDFNKEGQLDQLVNWLINAREQQIEHVLDGIADQSVAAMTHLLRQQTELGLYTQMATGQDISDQISKMHNHSCDELKTRMDNQLEKQKTDPQAVAETIGEALACHHEQASRSR